MEGTTTTPKKEKYSRYRVETRQSSDSDTVSVDSTFTSSSDDSLDDCNSWFDSRHSTNSRRKVPLLIESDEKRAKYFLTRAIDKVKQMSSAAAGSSKVENTLVTGDGRQSVAVAVEDIEEDVEDLKFLSDSFPLSHHMDPAKSKRTPEEELRNGNWLPDELEVTSTRLEQELSKLGRRLGRAGDEQFTLEYYCPPEYKVAESYEEWSEADLKEFIITVWEKVKKFHSQFFQQQQQQQQQMKTRDNSTTSSSSGKAERPKGGGEGAAAAAPVNVVAAGGTAAVIITSIDDVWPRVKGNKKPKGRLTAKDTEDMARLVSNAIQDVCHTEELQELEEKLVETTTSKLFKDTVNKYTKAAEAIDHKQLPVTQRLEKIEDLIDGLDRCRKGLEFLKREVAKQQKHKPTADSSSARKQPVTPKHTGEPPERRKSLEGKPSGSRPSSSRPVETKSSTKSESKKTTPLATGDKDLIKKKQNITTAADGSGPREVFPHSQPTAQLPVITTTANGSKTYVTVIPSTAAERTIPNITTSGLDDKPVAVKRLKTAIEQQNVDPHMSAQCQAEAMQLQMEELQRQLEASQTEIVTTTAQLERNQLDNNHKQAEIEHLKLRLQRMETELNTTRQQLELKRTEFADLKRTADDREVRWSSIVQQTVRFTAAHQPQQQPTTSALPAKNTENRKRSDSAPLPHDDDGGIEHKCLFPSPDDMDE